MKKHLISTHTDMRNLFTYAALEFTEEDNGGFYIKSYKFNIWVRFAENESIIYLNTWWPVKSTSTKTALLSLANICNQRLSFVQFCLNRDGDKFCGFHQISSKDGVDSRLILRTMSTFAAAFHDALNVLDEDDLIGIDPEIEAASMQREDALIH